MYNFALDPYVKSILEVRWATRIETSLVIVIVRVLMLRVLICIASTYHVMCVEVRYILWIGVVRFAYHEVWFDKGFLIWHFLHHCLVQIVNHHGFMYKMLLLWSKVSVHPSEMCHYASRVSVVQTLVTRRSPWNKLVWITVTTDFGVRAYLAAVLFKPRVRLKASHWTYTQIVKSTKCHIFAFLQKTWGVFVVLFY